MANSYFQFKQFRIEQGQSGMKVTTDGCFFGAVIEPIETGTILDIGSGTGLLSLMLAQRCNAHIDAIEINEKAYEQTKQNFNSSAWASRLSITHEKLQDFHAKNQYDQIICNPPFFTGSQKGKSAGKNQAIHANSLSAHDLVEHSYRLINPDGSLWVMYPEFEMRQFIKMAKIRGLHLSKRIILKNFSHSPIFREIVKLRHSPPTSLKEEVIFIRNKNEKYSSKFTELLRPYYLQL